MSTLVRMPTVLLLALPLALLASAPFGSRLVVILALVMMVLYAWVWLRLRPSRFFVHPGGLLVRWPLRRREIRREEIAGVRVVHKRDLRKEFGWGLRIGAGGLWGVFGWLWTRRRGMVRTYVTRTDRFVLIDRTCGRPWLITPDRPEAFVRALQSRGLALGSEAGAPARADA